MLSNHSSEDAVFQFQTVIYGSIIVRKCNLCVESIIVVRGLLAWTSTRVHSEASAGLIHIT